MTDSSFEPRVTILGSRGDLRAITITARPRHCDDGRMGGECCAGLRTHGETRCRNFSRPLTRTDEGVERAACCMNRERMHKSCIQWVTIDNFGVIQFEWFTKANTVEVVQIAPAERDGSRLIVKWANGTTPSVSDWFEKGSGERDQVIREVLAMMDGYDGQNGMPV